MKKRKLFVGLLVASAALGLASCGSKKPADENPDNPGTVTPDNPGTTNPDNPGDITEEKTLESISISGGKKEFKVGDTFDKGDLKVTAKYSDKTEEDVTTKATVSTPDMATAGEKEITVTYNGKEVKYKINVRSESIEKTLESISVSGGNKAFVVGDTFDKGDLKVTAKYSDNTEEDVTTKATVSDPDMTTAGEKEITVTYNGKEIKYFITVSASKYTITFNVGAHGTAPEDIEEVSTIPAELPVPENEDKNWTFGGWYLENTFDTKVNGGEILTEGTTLYAKWLTPYEAFLDKGNVVYQNTFDEPTEVECVGTDETPTGNIYGSISDNAVDFNNTNKVIIEDGKLKVLDTSALTTNGFIMFDTITAKKVEIYVEMTVTANNGSWSILNLIDESGAEIASVRTISSGKLGFRANNVQSSESESISLNANDTIVVEITLDLVDGKVSFTYNGKSIGEGNITATSLAGIKLTTAAAASRDVYIDNLGVRAENAELSKVQEILNAKIDAFYTGLDVENKYVTNGAILIEKYNSGKGSISEASTVEECLQAYEDLLAELKSVESDAVIALKEAKAAAITELEGYNADKTYTINAEAKTKAVEDGIAAINKASSTDKVSAALTAAKAAIDGVADDETAISNAQTAAIQELNNYKSATDYTINATTFGEALGNGESAINNATTMEDIASALQAAKDALDAIDSDAVLLEAAKETATATITNYMQSDIDEIDATEFEEILTEIASIKTNALEAIENATTIDGTNGVDAIVSEAKEQIETQINLTKVDIPTAKQNAINELNEDATEIKGNYDETDDKDLLDAIDEEVTKGINAIDEATTIAEISKALKDAQNEIDALVAQDTLEKAKAAAKAMITEAYDSLIEEVTNEAALTALNNTKTSAVETIDSEDATLALVESTKTTTLTAFDDIVAKALGSVTLVVNSETCVISWESVENATEYEVYVNDVKKSTQAEMEFTLSAEESGDYAITVKAIATDYYTSNKSNAITITATVTNQKSASLVFANQGVSKSDADTTLTSNFKTAETITINEVAFNIAASSSNMVVDNNGLKFQKTDTSLSFTTTDAANIVIVLYIGNDSRTMKVDGPDDLSITGLKKGNDSIEETDYTISTSLDGKYITITLENAAVGTYSIASETASAVYTQSVTITPLQSYAVKDTE